MHESIITTTNLNLAKDEVISIQTKRKYNNKPGFYMVGDGTMSKHYGIPNSIDLLQEVATMTADEKLCFFAIKNGIRFDRWDDCYIYQVVIRTSEMSATHKKQFTRGFKLLKQKDLVRRIRRGVYMINPSALIPTDFEKEFAIWSTNVDV